ncbi:type I-C CRISPR-associated protein Cas8c/Csd1 [Pontibacillus litoralis]|uniref:CRISPR-associated protein Cas8 n=1 Tax=Pontibacillus litoralis JSM 072002 TaxID=1385512 RepID=A0A0A5GAH3_9BACI|nr:type I-C CRISPR-associated protein Cas8c/Csd1 [Pontibacillus litoralis]KGX88203.1 CRISPR-associated protein Cas8 [Pontibacillus litoralis JSM 072002]
MSWLYELYETYNSNVDRIGEVEKKRNGQEYTLLPISHTTQNAHIEVDITEDGEFHSARVIDKNHASTLIPCTESSASRSGKKVAPYPLHDKLSYVAGDYVAYSGATDKKEQYETYIQQLEEWVHSPYSHEKVVSIFTYLNKKQLIKDLVNEGILFLDEASNLISKWNKNYEKIHGEKPEIFGVATGGQESAFVRFNVYSPTKLLDKVWNDKSVYDSFIQFYNQSAKDADICFVSGQVLPSTERHANKIRHAADKAKLISSNDSSGFTYRGRFDKSGEAVSISYEVSQKAHNALKWLIHRQGRMIDQRVFLIWGNDKEDVPDLHEDTFSFFPVDLSEQEIKSNTLENYANEISKAMDGYRNDLSTHSKVNILVLDSATTGRLAVLYYRNMNKELYLKRLNEWHQTCVWVHRYRKNEDNKYVSFYGTPATKDIAFAAYGSKANEKLQKELMTRMYSCIIDGRKIPQDIERNCFYRTSNPVSMDKWEWEKTLSITCALINKREGYGVALNDDINNRDYLFGRLLAIADVLERRALGPEETRATNAIRYMNSFAKHPERTWTTLQASLQPYQARLGTKALDLSKLIDEVASRFEIEDFNNKPLSGKYLLGFYSQRRALYQKKKKETTNEGENE